jgi:hypothetical protein
VNKLAIAVAVCGSLIAAPVQAKTFVGVLWPMFGPLPAIGLVELVGELKMMPDVEVKTYLHQSWPSLVKDIDGLPPGTHTVVVGYSLGANASVFVANQAKYVDLIIALQPSLLSWNPPVTGNVGRMIEIYNPNRWMTFGGMGSRKLIGPNIEYIANDDSHPGAQFDPQFRNLVKREIAKFTAEDSIETAQAELPEPLQPARSAPPAAVEAAVERPQPAPANPAAAARPQIGLAEMPAMPISLEPATLGQVADEQSEERRSDVTAFLDRLSSSVNSGDLTAPRRLTLADLKAYAKRTYRGSLAAERVATASD